MTELGIHMLSIALAMSGYAAVMALLSGRTRSPWLLSTAVRAVYATFALVFLASLALLFALINRNFQLEYVAHYTNRSLSLFYTAAAFWAGQAGSLLFWALLLTFFSVIVVLQNRARNSELLPYIVSVMSFTTFFFIYLLVFKSNPFAKSLITPADGNGLNPLLQNPEMIFHPPSLYVGFVGFTVPFAFSIAALMTKKLDEGWLKSIRRWTLFAWLFLTIGNLLGMQWAYVELGWGGYWAWDPVENSSLLPWLTGTAFIHSIIVQERKGMLKVWNISLITLTFALTIFGTFVTRSGLISSVHAFGVSDLGPLFLGFLAIILIGSFALLYARVPYLRTKKVLSSWTAKESSFLLNNLFFVAMTLGVFIGTIMPTISEAMNGEKVTVGAPFFNRMATPIGLAIFLLLGICALVSWSRTRVRQIIRNGILSAAVTVVVLLVLFFTGIRRVTPLAAFGITAFTLSTTLVEFIRDALVRRRVEGSTLAAAFFSLLARNKRRYGGYIVHIGVALFFLGIIGSSAFSIEQTVTLNKGDQVELRGFRLRYQGLDTSQEGERLVHTARFEIFQNGRSAGTINSEKHHYPNFQPATEVGIRSTVVQDLYIVLSEYDINSQRATVSVLVNPLVLWMWIGGLIMTLGTLLCLSPRLKKRRNVPVGSVKK